MRAVALLAVTLSVALLAGSTGLAWANQSRERSRTDERLTSVARNEALRLEEYFARARAVVLITAHNPSFKAFYSAPGDRVTKIRGRTDELREAEDALVYLERLYPGSIGEACFIDRLGPENARYVSGVRARLADLSPDETGASFFKPTFALPAGQVYQAKPYRSPDTHAWVISNSTPVPGTGRPAAAIVHFEVSVASFQREAAALARGVNAVIIDEQARVIVDSGKTQELEAPLGSPGDHRFADVAAAGLGAGTTSIDGHRAAFRHLTGSAHNANSWTVVTIDESPAPSLAGAAGYPSLGMFVAALALLLVGAAGFRGAKRSSLVEADARADEERRARAERAYHETQREFTEVMQATRDEGEAYHLLKRHLERSVDGSEVVVLNRNNSHDRLEPMTELHTGSALRAPLQTASPDSCLAVRLGKMHERGPGHDPLLTCDVCGKVSEHTTCVPALVGGEVIGSVLVLHGGALEEQELRRVDESMTQASPVLANLRNLALSETRALTDGLTGLPNRRAVEDTVKRMVAHANRVASPLGILLLDLDHFKQINDVFGHEKGDEVLSTVGVTIATTMRASDFAGRFGGEELIVLLPDTDLAAALIVAEKLRAVIASVELAGVSRPITASFGVAAMPEHGTEPAVLLRTADRALYAAKAAGRNRVETVVTEPAAPLAALVD